LIWVIKDKLTAHLKFKPKEETMYIRLLIILSFFIMLGCHSQDKYEIIWECVRVSPDGKFMVAAAMNGYIYTSEPDDEGEVGLLWEKKEDSGRHTWTGLALADNGRIAACVKYGHIYTSNNYGETWTVRNVKELGERSWSAIAINGSTIAATVSAELKLDLDELEPDIKESDIEHGTIYVSTNFGVDWTEHKIDMAILDELEIDFDIEDLTFNWRAITILSSGKIIAACSPGLIFTYPNLIFPWLPLFVHPSSKLELELWTSTASSSDGTKLIASHAGSMSADEIWGDSRLYISKDSGNTWEECNINHVITSDTKWSNVTSSEDGQYLAATVYGGYIYTSSDGGDSWTARLTDNYRLWYSISSCREGKTLIASNYDGSVYFSTNFGSSWTKCKIDE